MTCPHCHGLLRRDESGPKPWPLVCQLCGREADAPPVDGALYKGMRPGETPYGAKHGANPHPGPHKGLGIVLPYGSAAQRAQAKRMKLEKFGKLADAPSRGRTYVA